LEKVRSISGGIFETDEKAKKKKKIGGQLL
jgi:hypothetical protein